jgi:hypothetical protein
MPETDAALHDSLPATLARAFAMLSEGVTSRRGAAHSPALATIGLDGRPRLRTVVLREVDEAARTLRFHTDRRSEKVPEIEREPRVALHVYDQAAKFQMRVEGRASLHRDDAVADAAWAGSRAMSRACYGTVPAPGRPIGEGGAFRLPEPDELDAGRANFAAVVVTLERIETLHLAFTGHRRALFRFEGTWGATWLVP